VAYTERLKNAQLAKLKQRYLDLMAEAQTENARKRQDTEAEQRALYTDYALSRRDLPQQLAAAGKTGGMGDEALRELQTAYSDALSKLEQAQQRYMEDYAYELRKQKRLMDLAVEEYLARVAASGKKSSGKSGSKSSSKSSSSVSAADSENLTGPQNVRRPRMEQLVSSSTTAMGSGVRTHQVK